MVIGACTLAAFATFWFDSDRFSRLPRPGAAWLPVVLFVLLSLVVWHRIVMDALNHVLSRRLPVLEAPREPEAGHRVAFLTTFVPGSEPVAMLRNTLQAMVAADYPHDTWVLDEGDDDDVRRICSELGVKHFSRRGVADWNQADGPFAARTKGGNHNAWYAAHGDDYDIVAQVDTDFVVRPDFLTRTLPEFHDSDVAWVVTPQIYGNTDSFVARAAGEQQFTFYGSVLRGLSARRMALMLGANHVVRVAALRREGWYEGHLTEDMATGIKLHAAGWRSTYVAEPLAVGEGPTTWLAYVNQQMRWSFGCFDILRRVTWRRLPHLDWRARLYYVWLQQNYFSGLTFVVGAALLVFYFLTGVAAAAIDLVPLLTWYAPYLVWRNVHNWAMTRFNVRPDVERGVMLAGRVVGVFVQPVYFLALLGVLRGKHLSFKVTPKGGKDRSSNSLAVFRPQVGLAVVMSAAVAVGVALGHTAGVLLAWAAVIVVGMLLVPALHVLPGFGSALVGRVRTLREGTVATPSVISLPQDPRAGVLPSGLPVPRTAEALVEPTPDMV